MARNDVDTADMAGMADMADMDRRVCHAVGDGGAALDTRTEFRFRQAGDMVWGRYSGGRIRMGFFVGTSDGRTVAVAYTQLSADGATATGHSVFHIEQLGDGRVRLHATWSSDSGTGHGAGVLEEDRRP